MAFSKWNNGMMGLALVFQYFFIPMTQIFMDICGSEHFSIMQQETIKLIDITEIEDSPYQGRFPDLAPAAEETSATDELAVSIEKNGLMQPIFLRPAGDKYQLIDGHRRLMAFKRLGRKNIPAIVKEYSEREAQIFSVIANLQRKNLRPVELALSFQKILDAGIFPDKKDLSLAIGKDDTYVGDVLNTLKMDQRIIEHLSKTNSIKDFRILRLIRNAYPAIENESEKQWELYTEITEKGLSRQEVKELCKLKTTVQRKQWKISVAKNLLKIDFNIAKLSTKQVELFINIIENKLPEISGKLESIRGNTALRVLPDYEIINNNGHLEFRHNVNYKANKLADLAIDAILKYQSEYFLTGDKTKIIPMTLKDIAGIAELDFTLISKAIKNKYAQAEFGLFSLKSLFSESTKTKSGEKVSNLVVKKIIEDYISNEDKTRPVSDEKLTGFLNEKGYIIARRTVAKYREQLNIPASHLRKEL